MQWLFQNQATVWFQIPLGGHSHQPEAPARYQDSRSQAEPGDEKLSTISVTKTANPGMTSRLALVSGWKA